MPPDQRRLFAAEPDPWDADDRQERVVATVVFVEGPSGDFDYMVPDALLDEVQPGRRLRVPLGKGNRLLVGYCVAVATKPTDGRPLKSVAEVLDRQGLLTAAMLRLTRWIADYYLAPWGQVLEAVVPSGVRAQAGTRLTTLLQLADDADAERLRSTPLTAKQSHVLKVLAESPDGMTAIELARAAQCTTAPIKSLRIKGFITARTARIRSSAVAEKREPLAPGHRLNADQQAALKAVLSALAAREPRTILIHGVTGSGKTEVYIRAIEEVVGFRRQAIVLVPEISLTPQTVERFRSRLGRVAVLHSHLSDVERHREWQRIASGDVTVVVGARSAIFAPTPNLGLIILDEEHESSFKQDTAPRYHARDVALERSQQERVPLVLGSATPSLESWQRAATGEYCLVEMPRRVLDRPLPAVDLVDLRLAKGAGLTRGAIHRQLHSAMREALDGGGQVILLLNRRGFSTHIQCPACGQVAKCPDCDIALTHHRTQETALCHYCDHEEPAPRVCSACRFAGISYSGFGTQRLEAEVRARFPDIRCLRMDTDTMQTPGSHERAFAAFRSGEIHVLLGTQMIAKGLDFPNVTLVGVINADTALHLPDFRAAERTFHLVTQVAGRTGRGEKGGRVLVQTFNPEHPAIRAAAAHDYRGFAAQELPLRQALAYPPFSRMVRLVVRGPVEPMAEQFAAAVAEHVESHLKQAGGAYRLLGPAPAPISKLRSNYRFQIQLHGPDGEVLRGAVRSAMDAMKPPENVQWIADVDPLDML